MEDPDERNYGLLFPNWTMCKYSSDGCPPCYRVLREYLLLMHTCSNNDSVRECEMYRLLEGDK